ncbi:uncharacterized protein LOC122072575 [Macadamia integrifolia]|uniref:uncharacterized protein LOC122072575 n=1 Tax=Macadamia integrifolia TaxID=60698 RepID=UPI001C4EABDE|nr:uncharacterized protein LOC122072575 [Macadamia integrifolia]
MPNFFFLSFCLLFTLLVPIHSHSHSHSDSLSHLLLPSETTVDLCAETSQPSTCPVNCFRTNPVCGVDGITYWCGCADAMCAGTRVAKLGFCEVGNGGSGPVSGQALLLVHIVWLIVLGFTVLLGFF